MGDGSPHRRCAEVILKHVKLGDLKPDGQDPLDILKEQLAAVKAGRRERVA